MAWCCVVLCDVVWGVWFYVGLGGVEWRGLGWGGEACVSSGMGWDLQLKHHDQAHGTRLGYP